MVFGEVVRDRRRLLGITQEELADRTGLSVRSIRDIETNRVRAPRPATVRLLADAFDLQGADRRRFHESAADADMASQVPVPAQLPADIPAFTGRTTHIARLATLLDGEGDPATVVISAIAGTAGIGKTALAIHWAHQIKDQFPDGQLYVNLRGFDPTGSAMAPGEAIRGFLDAFGIPAKRIPVGLQAQVGLYRSRLAGRRVLVVLDNARDAEQVRPLLPGSPGCLVLVTSRNQLSGLVATDGAHPLHLDLPSLAEARSLLAGRLGTEPVAAEPDAVDEIITICARLPLALAIVAARAAINPGLPLAKLAAELRDVRGGLDPFAGLDSATDVRAVFSWSYRALSPPAARLFRLLGLHPGPDISGPAAASLTGVASDQVRQPLAELAGAHLVAEHAPGRYAFHDLLRAYAAELAQTHDTEDDRQAARGRMLDHYLHTAHGANNQLDPHRDPIKLDPAEPGVTPEEIEDAEHAQAWFTVEHAVLLGAIRLAAGTGFEAHTWQLAWTTANFLDRQGHWQDMLEIHRAGLDAAQRQDDRAGMAHAHRGLGVAYTELNREEETQHHLTQALALYGQLGDLAAQARTHLHLGGAADRQGRHEQTLYHAEQALQLYRAAGHRYGQARALNGIGWCHAQLGDYPQALSNCERALAMQLEIGDRAGEANTWDSLGYIHHHSGDFEQARACYHQALALNREIGYRYAEAEILTHLGDTLAVAGDAGAARQAWQQALDILDQLGHADADKVRAKLR